MANSFYVEPASPLKALMAFDQSYDSARKRTKEADQQAALQKFAAENPQLGPIAQLIGTNNVPAAQALSNMELARSNQAFQHQEARRQQSNADRTFGLQERAAGRLENQIPNEIESRRKAAVAQGMDTADPNVRSFILSGRMPREDQQPLTATDKKAILEADEGVLAAETAIDGLKKAKEISRKAFTGPFASQRGYISGVFGNEAGQQTTELDNIVTGNALTQLKLIFGGMPTEGERKILLELQGSSSQPDAVRQNIYDRAIQAAEARLRFNRQRAQEMRGGTFYKTQGTTETTPSGKSQNRLPQGSGLAAPPANSMIGGGEVIIGGGPAAPAGIPPPPPGFVVQQ